MAASVKKKVESKEIEPGLVYLSTIPTYMNVKGIRERFSSFGEVGRIFLQPDGKVSRGKKASKTFSEGWVEFKNKKIAKRVAKMLNGTQVGGKRRSPFYECLWNIKYLHRFKWAHLSEKLAYEKAVRDQRLRTEISQVKRESSHYVQAVEKSQKLERLRKKRKKNGEDGAGDDGDYVIKQRSTDAEIREMKRRRKGNAKDNEVDRTILESIFTNDSDHDKPDI